MFLSDIDLKRHKFLVLVNTNLRYDLPLFNVRVSYNVKHNNLLVFNFGK
jgi:hypothetical protein